MYIEIVMATNHNPVPDETVRLIYITKNKVGWNRDIDSPRQKMNFSFFVGAILIYQFK